MASAEQLTQKAFELARQGKLNKALQFFEKAFDKDPNLADALYGQGAVHYRAGNHETARKIFSRVLDMRPTHERALKYLNKCDDIIEKKQPQGFQSSGSSEDAYGGTSWDEAETSAGEQEPGYPASAEEVASDPYGSDSTETFEEPSDSEGGGSLDWETDDDNSFGPKDKPPVEEKPKGKGSKVMKIVAINVVLLLLAGGAIFAVHSLLSGAGFFSSKTTTSTVTRTEDDDSLIVDATGEIILPEGEEGELSLLDSVSESDSESSEFVMMLGTIMNMVGFVLSLAMSLVFLVAAFSQSAGKGILCFCCPIYMWIFILLEYRSDSKWLWVGLYVLGGLLKFLGQIMTGSSF